MTWRLKNTSLALARAIARMLGARECTDQLDSEYGISLMIFGTSEKPGCRGCPAI